MSVSNFLVVNLPTEKQSAINEVQNFFFLNNKSLNSLFGKTKIKKFKLTFKFHSHFNL